MKLSLYLESKPVKLFIVVVLSFILFIILSQKIDLVTADLGRHLKNGEYFFQQFKPVTTNYYSYTLPENPTVNHHWFSGAIFYLVYKLAGFYGLSLFYVGLYVLALGLLFGLSVKKNGFYPTLFSFILFIPLFAHRREIRPEIFSYLGIIFYLLIFEQFVKINKQNLILGLLFIYQLFWSNSHIYAFIGPVIVGLYILNNLIRKKYQNIRQLLTYELLAILSLILTPFGLTGFIKSLFIMHQYGYRLAENMSLWFMINWTQGKDWIYIYGLVLIISSIIYILFSVIKNKKISVLEILVIMTGVGAFIMNRNLPLFAIFTVLYLSKVVNKNITKVKTYYLVMIIFVLTIVFGAKFNLVNANNGFGLQDNIEKSAIFYKSQKLAGPIFNNYDDGGYLIYELFPQEKVFVDNRPEAYTKEFFDKVYNPALADENKWQEIDEKYNLNTIYFYRHDMTDNAQAFLLRRIQDQNWVPVYVDDWMLMLLKDTELNADLINKFALPKEIFSMGGNN